MHLINRSAATLLAALLFVATPLVLTATSAPASPARQDGEGQDQAQKPAPKPVDFRKLKEALPAELAGLKRTQATGQTLDMGEFKLSQAEGAYGADAQRIRIIVTDYAGQPELVEAMTIWRKMELDSESDTGYEKTLKIQGFPAMETFNRYEETTGSGTMNIAVGRSLVVVVETEGMTQAQFQAVRDKLPLKALEKVAGGPTTKPAEKE